jgi:hypothetical protein
MPRSYGEKFLRELSEADPGSAGVKLGRLCVDANLPAAYVSRAMMVSRMTVYSWFRGRSVSERNLKMIDAFTDLVKQDMEIGVLPARNLKDARAYLSAMVGTPM